MAKVKYSALIESMRNKLNGSVASRNRYGNYWRNKTTPINRQTSYQVAVRSQFAANSSKWRGLTQEQRDAWIAAAPNYPFTDEFGDQLFLSGNSLFLKINQNLQNMGASTVNWPQQPVAVENPDFTDLTVTASTTTVTVAAPTSANGTLMVYAAANVSPGKKFVKNLYKYLGTITGGATPVDINSQIVERFGAKSAGTAVWVKILVGDNSTGQQGQPVEMSAIVPTV